MKEILRPLLTKGEEYTTLPDKSKNGPRYDYRPSYEVAKERLISNIESIETKVKSVAEEYLMDDIVINVKMRLDRSSKSDHPNALLRDANLRQVGTKRWSQEVVTKTSKKKVKFGKDIFVLVNRRDLGNIKNILNNKFASNAFIDQVRSVEEIYFDEHTNILKSFNKSWQNGRVEVILHPYKNNEDVLLERFKGLVIDNGGNEKSIKIRMYEDGPIFISMIANIELVNKIKPFNLLRSIHPIELRNYETEKITSVDEVIPPLSDSTFVPEVSVGVFDGGITSNHPILSRYVVEHNLTNMEKKNEYIEHGNAVVGAALFGDLKKITTETLPVPTVKVESFRVLPLEDDEDYFDLYEVIDNIERVALDRPDIKVFNLSLGPVGPIEDDVISRFTYSLDRLSKDGDRIFVIAVGNDGYYEDELGRIQAPADSVNNLGVGSYYYENEEIKKASYSCYGDGREGAKVKPDIMEIGGDEHCKMHFIGCNSHQKMYGCGTSFSAPIVSRKLAEIIGYTSIDDPLTAKAVMIHTSEHPNKKPDKYFGYGIVKDDYFNILECMKNKVTVVYQSTILKGSRAKLTIPFVLGLDFDGRVRITWTICIATNIDASDADDYTNMCIEDTFYPNSHKYRFIHPITRKTKILHEINDEEEMKILMDEGWNKSSIPVSHSNSKSNYATEQERRNDFKWDTVVKRESKRISYNDIESPFIIIHAISRDKKGFDEDRIKYAAVVTIEYIKCDLDVYSETASVFNKLEKADIRNINEIKISN